MAEKLEKVENEPLLYWNPVSEMYFLRKRGDGEDTHISLKVTKIGEARKLRDDYLAANRARKLGLAAPPPPEPEKPKEEPKVVTVRTILTRYKSDGYPDKRGNARGNGDHLVQETASVLKLDEWFQDRPWDSLTQNMLDQYHEHRVRQINPTKDTKQWDQGHRTTDLELNCLSNAFNWAVRKEMIKYNPIARRIKYHVPSKARHAKDVAPQSAEEVHKILDVIFENSRSESVGMQAAYEFLTGQRTEEALNLRVNAQEGEPGHVMGDSLRVRRAEKAERENPFTHIHEGLKSFMKAHKAWLKLRYPKSTYWFPGRDRGEDQPVAGGSLTRLLENLLQEEKLKRKITSHGMRGGYVLVRRSWGIPDSQICWECNQIGGTKTLEQSYGGVPPHWRDGKGPKLKWLPQGRKPAWDLLVERLKKKTKQKKLRQPA